MRNFITYCQSCIVGEKKEHNTIKMQTFEMNSFLVFQDFRCKQFEYHYIFFFFFNDYNRSTTH